MGEREDKIGFKRKKTVINFLKWRVFPVIQTIIVIAKCLFTIPTSE